MMRPKQKAPLSIMEKKLPVNPKYAKTQSKIDSGNTINKIRLISNKEFLKRRDETFRRITCQCLAELFNEYEDTGNGNAPEMVAKMVQDKNGKFVLERVPSEDNQASSAGGPRVVSYDADESVEYDVPYLILDTRTKEEFAANRIHRAKNFPATFLNRDYLLPEMHRFKNQDSKLIVIYDLDEKVVCQVAHTLVQRGFDNVYVLTGGLVDYADLYPDHIEGQPLPKKAVDPNKKTPREVFKTPSGLSSTVSTTGPKSVKSMSRRSRKGGDDMSEVSSVMSSMSVAETVISRANARKGRVMASNYR